jgi:putative tricarboxylic transport membrane protein
MNTDKSLGVGLLMLGAAGLLVASQISVNTFNDDPGPKLFPMFACAILVLCGTGLLLTRSSDGERATISAAEWGRGAAVAVVLVGYGFGLWLVGFHVASFIAVYGLYHIIAGPQRRILWRGLVWAAVVTAGVHLLFGVALGAFLPRGILL